MPDFTNATIIINIHDKKLRKLVESAVINVTDHIKQRPGSYHLTKYLSSVIVKQEHLHGRIKVDFG